MAERFLPALTAPKPEAAPIHDLDSYLTLRTYIKGHTQTEDDIELWKAVRKHKIAVGLIKQGSKVVPNLARWFNFIEQTAHPTLDIPVRGKESSKENGAAAKDEGGSYDINLPDTDQRIITRFPPEPSGYLHVGHMKAALLNDYFAHKKYPGGKMILRFDDTNPDKEKEEFQDSIVKDLELMAIKPDEVTYTSNYFDLLRDKCIELIKAGKAYADDTSQEQLRAERMDRVESKHRNADAETSLAKFKEMEKGSEEGTKWYIRAKIDMASDNGRMRDPVIYRCNPTTHHRTGEKFKMYPTYDFACPIVDAHEGITHALRTTEYNDANEQYQWFLKTLGLRKVHNWNFSRMDFIKTFLSKRKLTKLVDSGKVWGWDDPRMPTVRGVRRRGMTVPALQEFILKQGPSKNITLQDWASFWATNKKYIDPVAPRYTAVVADKRVQCTVSGVEGVKEEQREVHAKNAELGKKKVVFSKSVILDQADAASFAQDEEITLMNWGNAYVRKISKSSDGQVESLDLELHLAGDVKKTSKKVTWLSTDQHLVKVTLYDFDYLITKDKLEEDDVLEDCLNEVTETRTEAIADCNVANLKEDDIVQFDRKGYFRIDKTGKDGVVAFQIPTGKGGK
ncbi:glutamate--tRNA ligase [Oleoguttula sp. CCFEE 5521]